MLRMIDPQESSKSLSLLLGSNGDPIRMTWLNHYTIQQVSFAELENFDFIGIDGTLLQLGLRIKGHAVRRTSADLFLPIWLQKNKNERIALIGGSPTVSALATKKMCRVVIAFDGYEGLAGLRQDFTPLQRANPTSVICSLGAPLQEKTAGEVIDALPNSSIFTSGAWLDQLAGKDEYFPKWVHALRLGWAIRVIREPNRMLKRYTIDALLFILNLNKNLSKLDSLVDFEYYPFGLRRAK